MYEKRNDFYSRQNSGQSRVRLRKIEVSGQFVMKYVTSLHFADSSLFPVVQNSSDQNFDGGHMGIDM